MMRWLGTGGTGGAGGADSRISRREAWTVTALVLLALAVALRQAPLALLGAGLLVTALSVELWQRYGLRGVTYTRTLGEWRAFFGEEVPLVVEIANRKLLPLSWLEVNDPIPAGLHLIGGSALHAGEPGRSMLRQVVSLGWFEQVRLRYRLRCGARGVFTIGPVLVRTGDPFGFAGREATMPVYDQLVVYPRVVPIERLGLPARHPFGNARDSRRLFEDPTRIAGVRPYTVHDSPRHIHWKASARLQQLQTRLYEPAAGHTLMLYVNLASFEGYWWAALSRDLLELAIVAAASVAAWALDAGYQVGVSTNGAPAGGVDELAVPPAGDPQHLVRILDALARISVFARSPLERILARDRTRLPWGTTVVAVTAVLPDPVLLVLRSFAASGHTVAAIQIGGRPPAGPIPGLITYHVPQDVPSSAVEGLNPRRMA